MSIICTNTSIINGIIKVGNVIGSNINIGHTSQADNNKPKSTKEKRVTVDIKDGQLFINDEQIALLKEGADLIINITGDLDVLEVGIASEIKAQNISRLKVGSGNVNTGAVEGNIKVNAGNVNVTGSVAGDVAVSVGNIKYSK